MTTASAKPASVTGSIDEVVRWRAGEEVGLRNEIDALDREIDEMRAAMAALSERLEARQSARSTLDSRVRTIANSGTIRAYQALFAALAEQAAAISERSGLVAAEEFARNSNLETSLMASSGSLFEEYRQFKVTVEPTLSGLPESYRKVLLAHHAELAAKVRSVVESAVESIHPLGAETLEIDVVWGMDSPDGTPDLLVMVVPADESVATGWADRGDDVDLWLAARVVQGLSEALLAGGLAGVRPALGGHRGLLAIEVDLADARPDFGAVLAAALTRVFAAAPELDEARVKVTPRQVDLDWLLPPESTEGSGA